MIRRNIPRERVLGHSDVSPGRKQDPGEKFPWQLLADSGVGLYVLPAKIVPGPALGLGAMGPDVLALQEALAAYGYTIPPSGQYDNATRDVVARLPAAFPPRARRRHRRSLDARHPARPAERAGGRRARREAACADLIDPGWPDRRVLFVRA